MRRLLSIIFIFLLVPLATYAIGIGATPAKINVTLAPNKTITQQVEIFNIEEEELSYRVSVDNPAAAIRVEPAEFTIAGNSTKKIDVTVTAGASTPSATAISVVARPATQQDFQPNAGIKIPIAIAIADGQPPRKNILWWILGAFVALVLLGVVAYYRKLKSSKHFFS